MFQVIYGKTFNVATNWKESTIKLRNCWNWLDWKASTSRSTSERMPIYKLQRERGLKTIESNETQRVNKVNAICLVISYTHTHISFYCYFLLKDTCVITCTCKFDIPCVVVFILFYFILTNASYRLSYSLDST